MSTQKKKTRHFQNYAENIYHILRTSYLHQSTQKFYKVLFQMTQVTIFENCCHYMLLDLKMVNPTTKKLVCCAGGKNKVSNSCITYILHTISDGTTWCTDFWGLLWKKAQTQAKVVSDTEGRPRWTLSRWHHTKTFQTYKTHPSHGILQVS